MDSKGKQHTTASRKYKACNMRMQALAHLIVSPPHPENSFPSARDCFSIWLLCHAHKVLCAQRALEEMLDKAPAPK